MVLEAGRTTGFSRLTARDSDYISIMLEHGSENYKILKVIKFDSDRKMMTVVV